MRVDETKISVTKIPTQLFVVDEFKYASLVQSKTMFNESNVVKDFGFVGVSSETMNGHNSDQVCSLLFCDAEFSLECMSQGQQLFHMVGLILGHVHGHV